MRDFAFSLVRSRGDSRGLPSEILLRGSANQVAGGKVDVREGILWHWLDMVILI